MILVFVVEDFNPRSPRGERLDCKPYLYRNDGISIHALREESDIAGGRGWVKKYISIHALREESDFVTI